MRDAETVTESPEGIDSAERTGTLPPAGNLCPFALPPAGAGSSSRQHLPSLPAFPWDSIKEAQHQGPTPIVRILWDSQNKWQKLWVRTPQGSGAGPNPARLPRGKFHV